MAATQVAPATTTTKAGKILNKVAPAAPQDKGSWVRSVVVLTLTLICAIPLYYIVVSAFKTIPDMAQHPLGLPQEWKFGNFGEAISQPNMIRSFVNSIILTVGGVGLQLMIGAMAAFAMLIGSGRIVALFGAILAIAFAIPLQATLVPQYRMFAGVGLTDSILGVVLLYSGGAVFTYFLIVGYMRGLPYELIEAPRIDGAGPFRIFWTIILPLCKPILITVTVFQTMTIWNDFLIPNIYLASPENRTVVLQVYKAVGQFGTNWPLFMATTVIVLLPVFAFFVYAQKWIVGGLMAGGVKG